MFSMTSLLSFLVLIFSSSLVSSTHFRGGIIMARPEPGGSEYEMEISFHVSWRRSRNGHYCDSQTISNQYLLNSEGSLTCQYWCQDTISTMSYYCTSFSTTEDWTFGERRFIYNFTSAASQLIAIGFTGRDWIAPFSSSWNISTTFSLVVRNDTGRINSTPRAITAPVIRLREGCNHTIPLAVSDPDGDMVRCRWAVGRECAGICYGFPGAYLYSNTCVITYQANMGVRYWAAAIMIEDFTPDSPTPLSSVALQFLVLVIPSTDSSQECSQQPMFIQPTIRQGSCVAIPPETTFTTQLIANSSISDASIMEIQVIPPLGTLVGDLTQTAPNLNIYYVNITWTPSVSQQNQTHMFCFTAVRSDGLTSEQNCIDLLPGFFPPAPNLTTLTPYQELVYPSNTVWQVQFDSDLVRPSVRADIAFHVYMTEEIVYSIDSSTSSEVAFEETRRISIRPNFVFEEKTEYYITFDRGIVQGLEHCGPGSEPVMDKNFWTFVVMDITPPVITFLENAAITNTNASFSWESNENVTWYCLLTLRNTVQIEVNCSEAYWRGYGLSEGVYRLEIRATDEAGNVANATHMFMVDTTPPDSAVFVRVPNPVSNQQFFTLSFSCDEICSFECSFTSNGTLVSISSCDSGEFTTPSLEPSTDYSLSVIAADQVGNRANSISYSWVTDFEPPHIFGDVQNTSATCENSAPESTGQAQAVDNRVEAVSLVYTDVIVSDVYSQCFISRTWTAMDAAGNVASLVQAINLDFSPAIALLPQVSLPCDSTEAEFAVSNQTASAPGPCGLELGLQLTYQDAEHVCPGSFVRNWTVSGCGRNTSALQVVFLYDLCPAHACGRNESTPRGICSLGECQCNRPWYGENCDILIYDPIAEDVNDTTLLEAEEYRTPLRLSQGSPPLVWSLISGPRNLIVDQNTGEVSWSRAQGGNHSVSVQIENQVNSTQVQWSLQVIPGYSAYLRPAVARATFPYPQPITLSGYVEYSPNNLVEDYLEGIVPVYIDITNNGTTRTINASTSNDGNFSVIFNPSPTEYGMYSVRARHPASTMQGTTSQMQFRILGMKSIPQVIMLNGEGIDRFEQTFYNASTIRNDGPETLSGLTATPVLPNTTEISVEIFLPANSSLDPGEQLSMDIRVVSSRLLRGAFYISVEAREGTMLQILTRLQTDSILPILLVEPSSINSRIIRGSSQIFQFRVTNFGGATANDVRAILPDVDLLSFVSFGNSQQIEGSLSLATGESAVLTLLSQSLAAQQFGVLRATIVIASSEASTPLPIRLTVSSNTLMNLTVVVEDEYTYFAGGRPLVSDAAVTLVNNQRNIHLTQSTTPGNGTTTFSNIYEDRYEIRVESPSHLTVRQIVITSINYPVLTVFLQRQTVVYRWSVTPTTFQDVYAISIEADFETRVPIPVVTATPHEINLNDLENNLIDSIQINITNHGLIRADDLTIQLPSHPSLVFSVSSGSIGHLEPLSSIIVSINSSRKNIQKRNAASRLLANGLSRAVNWVTYQINVIYSYVCNEPLFRSTPIILKEPAICSRQLGDFVGPRAGGRQTDPPSGDPVRPRTATGDNTPPSSPFEPGPSAPSRPATPTGDFKGYSTSTPQFCNPCISSVLGCLSSIPSSPEELLLSRFPYSGCIPVVQNILDGNISPTNIVSNTVDLLQCTIGNDWTGLAICAVRQNVFSTCLDVGTSNRKKRTVRTSITEVVESFYPIQQNIALGIEVLGDEAWLSVGDPQWVSNVLRPVMDDASEEGVLISSSELTGVLSVPPPNGTTIEMIVRLLNRINNTISGWNNGTLEPAEGSSSNIASFAQVQEFSSNINTYNDIAIRKGFSSFVDAYRFTSGQLNQIDNLEDEAGVCAVVRIRIQQELAITREAFLARLEIDNLEDSPLEEISIDIIIVDLTDRSVANHLFSIGNGTLSGSLRTRESGRWSLASDATGAVEWLIVPYSEAAPESQHIYTIGGSFSYIVSGENITVSLYPTPIVVSPDASLLVHYFLEKNVVADDPFTVEVEPSIPFTLGIAVRNAGYGTAYDCHISSSQPEIIDNDRGLLIDFMIIGANIGNERASPSLNVEFGDLLPNSTMVARWYMISSLQGEFSRYSATFENRNPLGDPRLSILDDLQTHELIRNVMIYTTNENDNISDFLVNDRNDYQGYPDTLYSSRTLQKYNVSIGTIISVINDTMAPPLIVRTTSNMTGWVYYRYEDTQGILRTAAPSVNGTKNVDNETIVLPPENSWITRDRDARSGTETFYLHIFDYTETTSEVVFMLEPCTLYCPVLGLPFSRPTVKLPTPSVRIRSPSGIVYAGTVSPLMLICTIEFDASLRESVNVSVAWTRGVDVLSNATERVTISPIMESSSSITSTLILYPVTTADNTNFTCLASISPTDLDRLSSTTASDVGSGTVSLNVQAPTVTLVSITTTSDVATAGDSLNITCSAEITPSNVIAGPVVTWSGPAVDDQSSLIFNVTSVNEVVLSFSPLRTSHGGTYTCSVTLNIPETGVEGSGAETIVVNVQIPSPRLTTVGFPRDTEFFQGIDLTLSCNIEVSSAVDSPVSVQTSWQRNGTILEDTNDGRVTVSNGTIMTAPFSYQATLRFNPLDFDDTETYTCTAILIPQNETFITGTTVLAVRTITNISSFPSQNVSVTEQGLSIAGHPNYTLFCTTTRHPHLTSLTVISIQWLDGNGVEVPRNEDFTIVDPEETESDVFVTSKLIFNSIMTSQAGEYICRTTLTIPRTEVLNHTVDEPFTVIVKLPSPASVDILQSQEDPLYEGIVFTLLCVITVNTTGLDTDFEIERNFTRPEELALDSRVTLLDRVISKTGIQISLLFSPLIFNDTNSSYECSALVSSMHPNVVNSDPVVNETTLSILRLPQPIISIYSSVPLPTAGGNHTLTCQVTTVANLISAPVLSWSSNTDISDVNVVTNVSTSALIFIPLHTSHGGMYTCRATINIPQAELIELSSSSTWNFTIRISPPVLFIADHPVPYNGTLFTLTGVAQLDPSVDTNVTAVGVWSTTDNRQVLTSPPYQADLRFQPLTPQNSKDYILNVTFSPSDDSPFVASTSGSISYDLTVQPLPSRPPIIAIASRHPSSENVCGEARIVNCTSNAVENLFVSPTVTWVGPDGSEVSVEEDSNPMFSPETRQLIFTDINANNSGLYMCHAVVNITEAQIINHFDETTINVKSTSPEVIVNLSCNQSLSPSELAISWEPPNDDLGEALSYQVEVRELQTKADSAKDVVLVDIANFSTNSQEVFLNEGLTGMVPYEIRVKAINVAGCGAEEYHYCFTQEGVPPSPKNVRVSEINSTAVTVTWEKQTLVELKGLADYVVMYKPIVHNTRKRQLVETVRVPWSENQVVLANLTPGIEYNVSVSTVTSAGMSDPVIGVKVISSSEDGDGVHYLGVVISGAILGAIILFTLLTALVVIVIFTMKKPKATYKPATSRSRLHDRRSFSPDSDDDTYKNPMFKDAKYVQYPDKSQ